MKTIKQTLTSIVATLLLLGSLHTTALAQFTDGGYTFTSFKWFCNGIQLNTTKPYIKTGTNGETVSPNNVYYVEMTATGVSGVLRICAFNVKP